MAQPDPRYLREQSEHCRLLRKAAACDALVAACEMVLNRWRFNNEQGHTHTWHDMQDCRTVILAAIAKAE